ncbi:uncharacterized protein TRIADDRAFT_57621 [Trichoplax adhaerens]|uniref:SMB domain-containing protein n=1 Tax=Trichoplax adhaerens TaxID=10228 RepID=B3RZY7_TRIAD|nr:predicted protein [Trichoplax adhaerens]EDV23915.1 predicted protein [Trichoplax adhaerens]|eukprot:XP_002113441.1 predicted protein [Trichoplax adhaerens]
MHWQIILATISCLYICLSKAENENFSLFFDENLDLLLLDPNCMKNSTSSYSCIDRCNETYVRSQSCNCDVDCVKYHDCCFDYAHYCIDQRSDLSSVLSSNTSKEWFDLNLSKSKKKLPVLECTVKSVLILGSCPENWPNDIIRSKCENPSITNFDYYSSVPVYQRSSSNNYRNFYCAICNGADIKLLQYWTTKTICSNGSLARKLKFIDYVKQYCKPLNSIHDYMPPDASKSRYCVESSRCNEIDAMRIIGEETLRQNIVRSCQEAAAYVHFKGTIYKNPYCARCSSYSFLECMNTYYPAPFIEPSYSDQNSPSGSVIMLIDFSNTGRFLYTAQKGNKVVIYAGHCQQGYYYDPLQMRCQEVLSYNRSNWSDRNDSDCDGDFPQFCNYTQGQIIHNCSSGIRLNSTQFIVINTTHILRYSDNITYPIRSIHRSYLTNNETVIYICYNPLQTDILRKTIFEIISYSGFALSIGAFFFIVMTYCLFSELRTHPVVTIYRTRHKAKKIGKKHGIGISDCRLYLSMITVVGVTWLIGILANIKAMALMWYPYLILNNLQGIFMIFAFILNPRKRVACADTAFCVLLKYIDGSRGFNVLPGATSVDCSTSLLLTD